MGWGRADVRERPSERPSESRPSVSVCLLLLAGSGLTPGPPPPLLFAAAAAAAGLSAVVGQIHAYDGKQRAALPHLSELAPRHGLRVTALHATPLLLVAAPPRAPPPGPDAPTRLFVAPTAHCAPSRRDLVLPPCGPLFPTRTLTQRTSLCTWSAQPPGPACVAAPREAQGRGRLSRREHTVYSTATSLLPPGVAPLR